MIYTRPMNEIWKQLYGFRNWEISNLGRMRKSFMSTKVPDKNGYEYAHLSQDNHQRKIAVHRAVWENFNGEIPPELMINHIDGNKLNNSLDNLEVVTNRENIEHYKKKLLTYRGSKVNTAKLTDDTVINIRRRKELGVSTKQLAKEHGVSISAIKRLINRTTWSHID